MKGIRFYLEYESNAEKRKGTRKNPGNHAGNCLAVFTDPEYPWSPKCSYDAGYYRVECLAPNFYHANSSVGKSLVSCDVLRDRCKHISEKLARVIHPALFTELDKD